MWAHKPPLVLSSFVFFFFFFFFFGISSQRIQLAEFNGSANNKSNHLSVSMLVCMLSHFCHVWYPMNGSLPGSSVHGIVQARTLEWVAMPSSRGFSQPRDRTCLSCTAGWFFTTEPLGKPQVHSCPYIIAFFLLFLLFIYFLIEG